MMLVVKANQLRFQDHLVGENGPELKLFKNLFPKCAFGSVIRSITIKALPGHRVDVIDNQVHIPLCKELEGSTFGKDHSQQRVNIFHAALLRRTHRIAIIDTGANDPFDTCFQGVRIAEFSPSVGKNYLEEGEKIKRAKAFFQTVKNELYGAFGTAIHQKRKEELFLREIEGKQSFFRVSGGMDGIHLAEELRRKLTEIGVKPSVENRTIVDLRLMDLSGLELHFALQINVPCAEQTFADVIVQRAHGKVQFRMIDKDLVRRLSLKNKRSNDRILFTKLMLGHVDTRAGVCFGFLIFPFSKDGVITILLSNGTFADDLITAIANIGSLVEPVAAFFNKVLACLVAGRTGMALYTAEDDLAAGVCLMAMITLFAEVFLVDKRALVVPV